MAHFVISTPLLSEGNKHYHTHHHTHKNYVPLLEEQADLYMKTEKYNRYLIRKASRDYFYRNFDGKMKPWRHPNTLKLMSEAQASALYRKKKEEEIEKDKVILMTEGINALPPEPKLWEQVQPSEPSICSLIFFSTMCFWNPCCWSSIRNKYKKTFEVKNESTVHCIRTTTT